ncbi:MAG: response regulator transcription factor [Chitinophagales bacterium]|nr:response regulator transcription factor [Chitinophagales bacterium]
MIKCLIVEDDSFSREILKDLIEENFENLSIISNASNIVEAKREIIKHQPDLVFLDVELPDGNSFDLLEKMKQLDFQIIFITSHDNYAIRAFKYSAVDYILKPIKTEALVKAVQKVMNRRRLVENQFKIEFLMNNLAKSNDDNAKIALPSSNGLDFVKVNSIIRCRAESNYTHIYLNGGEELIISRSLKEFEEILPQGIFYRIHKSHLINLHYLKKFVKHDGGYVVMEDGEMISVASRKKDKFLGSVRKM